MANELLFLYTGKELVNHSEEETTEDLGKKKKKTD